MRQAPFNAKGMLRPFIGGMTGIKMHDDEFPDLSALLGSACLLNVVHTGKEGVTYANIQNASPLPKGMEAPALFNDTRVIDINSTPFEVIDTLPEFIQKKMKSSEEYVGRVQPSANMETASVDVATQGSGLSKLQKPKVLGGPGNMNADDINPDDIPF